MKVHDESKSYKCDVCLKVFSGNADLKRHYRTHTGEKPFACQVCNKKFALKGNLVIHQGIHTGEKPFACHTCGKKFVQKGNLVKHQAIHSDVRSFKCTICPNERLFKTKCRLNNHMVYHFEPKFACNFCGRKFHTTSNLKTHEKTHLKK